jgi:hypothetical protein
MGSLRSGARKRDVSWKKATETASTGYMRKGRAFALPFLFGDECYFASGTAPGKTSLSGADCWSRSSGWGMGLRGIISSRMAAL